MFSAPFFGLFIKFAFYRSKKKSWVLLWFEAIFGLKINLEKSSILPLGIVENLEDLAAELGCRKGNLLTTYLGLPLGMKRKSI